MTPYCPDCTHYGDHGGRSGGTPPWPICRFGAEPETCGRFRDHGRPAYDWQPDEEKLRRAKILGACT